MPPWKEDFFSPSPKVRIYYRALFPEKVRGHVLLIHGYAEHSGRYLHVMQYLADRGYAVWAPDYRGHGRSARHLGDMESYTAVLDDLTAFKKFALKALHGLPFFLLGHSLGGSFALCLSALHPENVSGTIAIAPSILIPDYASPILIKISAVLAALFPRLPVQPLPREFISRDPAVLDAARQDPHYYRGKIMARMGYQMIRGIRAARGLLPSITLPLLLLHAGDDRIMPPEGSRFVHDSVASKDKTLHIFEHFYHEILNEPEKAMVLKMIGDWLDAHHA